MSSKGHIIRLDVLYHGELVGTLAETPEHKIAFSYSDSWIRNGFSINPFSLPLQAGVFIPNRMCFDGLFGIFYDSLPDAWGNLLLRRVLEQHNERPDELHILDRLAFVGHSGRGALEYEPAKEVRGGNLDDFDEAEVDRIANTCREVLEFDADSGQKGELTPENIDDLYRQGGSSGGTRPKINLHFQNEDWILKFPARSDPDDIGQQEYEYTECARACGIDVPEARLFASHKCKGYFAIKRFDRRGKLRIHMATAAALLEADPDIPCLDYQDLMKLTSILSGGRKQDLEQMFLRMCFNFAAHNMDDHSANFTWLYEEDRVQWHLSPTYDLTYSTTGYGEHTTSAMREGLHPSDDVLVGIGTEAGLSTRWCTAALRRMRTLVNEQLNVWLG